MPANPFEGLLEDFLLEARERIDHIEELFLGLGALAPEGREEVLKEARRELHTLKGNAGMMGLRDAQALAHTLEDAVEGLDGGAADLAPLLSGLDELRRVLQGSERAVGTSAPSEREERGAEREAGSVRVPFAALDSLVDLLAEMVIFRNRLSDAVGRGRLSTDPAAAWDEVEKAHDALGKTLGFIQDRVMRLRMVPLRNLFVHLKRIVHDEGAREAKPVHFEASGGDTPMDKALLEVASEALGHFVRNAVVHGIEGPDARAASGKPATGTVRLSASAHSEEVWVDVEDDGGGIDRADLLRAAQSRGISLGPGEDPTSLLFLPGFSTKEGADVSSGRGMGLSAAVEAVRRIGGSVEVASEPGVGSRFRLRMPLSVSILPAMLLSVDGEEYALPLSTIVESLRFEPGDGHQINHAGVFTWRDQVLPVLDLGHIFGTRRGIREAGFVVVMEAEGKRRGLVADDLTGIREIVVKALDPMVGHPPGIGASTILGDGRIILILDPKGLATFEPFVTGEGGRNAARTEGRGHA